MVKSLSSLAIKICVLVAMAVPAGAVTFGEQDDGNSYVYNVLGVLLACQFDSTGTGNINRIFFNIRTSGGSARVAVYDSGGIDLPGALLAESGSQTVEVGWNEFVIPSVAVTDGQTYWFACQVSNNDITYQIYNNDANNNRSRYRGYSYGAFPATFGTSLNNDNWRVCIYATEITPTFTPTATATSSPDGTSTFTITPTASPTATPTFTHTPTATRTGTQTSTATLTVSATPTPTSTISPTATESATFTATPSITVTSTITLTSTHSPVYTPTITPTITVTPTITFTTTITQTRTITRTLTISPTATISATRTTSATVTPTYTITLTPTPRVTSPDLSRVIVYPNPWNGEFAGTSERMVFMNLSQNPTIRIYTLAGGLVITLKPGAWADGGRTQNPGDNGLASWGMTNRSGQRVSSGVYIYIITDQDGREQRGKLAVKR